jgi:hypothetical protein
MIIELKKKLKKVNNTTSWGLLSRISNFTFFVVSAADENW